MGILSWEGRSGDAGKHGGWSPDEPTCSLNLSGERFLQFLVFPVPGDADPTSWSHAVPVGRWTHVAVVNDGHHTVIYVDGSKIRETPDGGPLTEGGRRNLSRMLDMSAWHRDAFCLVACEGDIAAFVNGRLDVEGGAAARSTRRDRLAVRRAFAEWPWRQQRARRGRRRMVA